MDELLHGMTIEDISRLRRRCEDYLEKWFGFSADARGRRTPEWVEMASRRLADRAEACCGCGSEYPAADLQFGGHVFCAGCRSADGASGRQQ